MNRPDNVEYCEQHYIPPNKQYIICDRFGSCDGMDGACWWCREMTRYQWEMCRDEHLIQSLLSPVACVINNNQKKTREEAIEYIEGYKQRAYKKAQEKNLHKKNKFFRKTPLTNSPSCDIIKS